MPKSKNKKDHKKRSQARTQKIKEAKNRIEKLQKDYINAIIKQEKEKGLYENLPSFGASPEGEINIDGPII